MEAARALPQAHTFCFANGEIAENSFHQLMEACAYCLRSIRPNKGTAV